MSYLPISDADASTKGLIQLAGDIGGSAGTPTIPALASKADAANVYTKAEVDAAVGAKADASALSGYIPATQKGAASGVATLDSSGKIPITQLQFSFPVSSVNTQTGDVVLTKSDLGLGNVDNTSDAGKPISTATQTALDAKADASAVTTALAGKANTVHGHAISDVTNLQIDLDAKADASAVYTKAQVDSALTAKADTSALANYVPTTDKGAANGVATLDSGGKVPSSQLPTSVGAVTSVNTQTGDVVLTKADVGLGNVDNTSDANKPISSATQTALDGKASTGHTHVVADVTNLQTSLDAKADTSAVTTALTGKANTVHSHAISDVTNLQTTLDSKASATHSHAIADVTGLQTALDGKAATTHTHTASEVSDSSAVGRSVLTAADALSAQSALGITNTVVVVDSFGDVTTPSYGTLYVVRA